MYYGSQCSMHKQLDCATVLTHSSPQASLSKQNILSSAQLWLSDNWHVQILFKIVSSALKMFYLLACYINSSFTDWLKNNN